ncbi:K(+)-transporting ATPase subunit C [Castellaniella sp.]|uniref:K(+)-transporting ATPase subunit C n=1 Tax=Castellaniella sp. TaxID=1955812 RepID=UPI002AFDCBEC|nr:K(+)-transporting ATPase subunit C [Castellaniella sp.]
MSEKPTIFKGIARPVIVSSVFFMALTGLAYPMFTTGVANLLFPAQAQGSLLERNGAVIGSSLIGQNFTRPEYFHPRPSATMGPDPADASKTVSLPYNAGLSGASNLGPTNRKLADQVAERVAAYRAENGLSNTAAVPVDAVTASASGLDPDISIANALLQVARVASHRNLPEAKVQQLLTAHTTGRALGVLGEPRVNVLQLNIALDALSSVSIPGKF